MAQITRKDNGDIEIELILKWPDIQQAYEHAVEEAIESTEIAGFRKGKAPRNLVEPGLKKTDLYSHAVQHLLPEVYAAALKGSGVAPVLYPKVTLKSGEEGKDWIFIAVTCEVPAVALSSPLKLPKQLKELNEKLAFLRDQARLKIPDLLIEEEANHRLSALAENITRLGLTTEAYLSSKKLTPESLKAGLANEAKTDLQTEFILLHIQKAHRLADRKSTLDFLAKLE